MRLAHDLRVIRAIAIKDILSSLAERIFTTLGVLIPLNYLLLFLLFVLDGGQAPTADYSRLAPTLLVSTSGAPSKS